MNKKSFLTAVVFISSLVCMSAQIKNAKTEIVKVNGVCGLCKSTIEKAGNIPNETNVVWNSISKTAVITYDAKQTSLDAILKRIADAGYDNEKFKAPDDAYQNLHACCQYDRKTSP